MAATPGLSDQGQDNLASPLLNYQYLVLHTQGPAAAYEVAKQTMELCPRSLSAAVVSAMTASAAGLTADARRISDQLIADHPFRARPYIVRALQLANQKKLREALRQLDYAQSIDHSEGKDDVAYLRAVCWLGLGDETRARKAAGPKVWELVTKKMQGSGERGQ